jgi:hypothetical protein
MTTTRKRVPALAAAILLELCLSFVTWAQSAATDAAVPRAVNYSSTAKDAEGKAISGVVGATFAVYAEQSGGPALWMETQNITAAANGRYAVVLGGTQTAGLPPEAFNSGQGRWLGVRYNGGPEQPRVALLSVPYALEAADAQTIGGLPPSAFVLASSAAPAMAAHSDGATPAVTSPSPDAASNVTTSGGTVDALPLWTTATNIQSSAIVQSGSGSTAKIGIGTTTPVTTLDVKGSTTVRGTLTLPAAGLATAGAGFDSHAEKLVASSFNSSSATPVNQTFQWQAEPLGNDTVNPAGTLNLLFGAGSATPAETGLQINNHGLFTFAGGQTFPGTGTITGVTAGTDLTGGGTSGNITLNLNTSATDARYAQLGAANSFTGNQAVTGNVTSTGTVQGIQGFFTNSTGTVPLEAVQNDTTRVDDAISGIIYSAKNGSAAIGGLALATSGQIFGVQGTVQSPDAFGIYGLNGARSTLGNSISGAGGVWGDAGTNGDIGVLASADDGDGLYAINNSPTAIAAGAANRATTGAGVAVYGYSYSPTGTGVVGQANGSSVTFGATTGVVTSGVNGDNGGKGGVGVFGTADSGYAMYGVNNGSYVTGLFINQSSSKNASLEAGSLSQNCIIYNTGDLQCTGTKSAVVQLPDQRWVRLYAVESPENWFEDFGSGQLASGRATIELDPTFAETVSAAGDYHVFLTPNGDSRGLYVTAKSATSFEVREQGGGASNVGFDYRIVAKRRGYEDVRLADVTERQNRLTADAKLVTEDNGQARTAGKKTLSPGLPAKH